MVFPIHRPRRLRRSEIIRRMVRESSLSRNDLIYPLFVCPGNGIKEEIASMPGNYHFSVDLITSECSEISDMGIPAVILFGITNVKDDKGSEAYSSSGIVQRAVEAIKNTVPELCIITDVCLCAYTSHGHCGVLKDSEVDNDSTLDLLARQAVSHARAGVDMVAPSDMMDGRVAAIRGALDTAGFSHTVIMSYAAKYASAYYGPFREAVDSAPRIGDRRSYQMDPPNALEALREVGEDIAEGADIVMVKPALAYLDVVYRVKERFNIPLAAYNVSGEYAMILAGCERGYLDKECIVRETLLAIKRAGADLIITYFAKEVVKENWLYE